MTVIISGDNGVSDVDGSAGTPAIRGTDANTGIYFPAADNIGFATGGTIRGRWTTDGLCFGSDTAAANALDDYEEGTWTPTLTASSGSFTSVTYTDASARYTKIGRFVFIDALLGWSAFSVGTASGNLQIGGLPFLTVNEDAVLASQTFNVNWPNSGTITAQPRTTSTQIQFRVSQDNGAWNLLQVSAQGASEQNYIRLSGGYQI